mmetsp:Transcript_135/g.244  ORF Transcript_135/g.244 Transcript_135/m.244 type:complete len:312 (-) Transcript_135:317-1252(-)|eukprot:CAMPEP_0198213478 /NCGR_PEP_ID=MMETSP1445-20131203/28888_1 /TAXON_ID=36898 /ORGANISM="Pyramimonas sp., Strain CCMP2087" /LENGTH=311 /DNA_ID=CAMNT_0043888129 /DNA_START=101 /DNA_END=1036 /DNA_ORIENTATION=-
MAFALKVPTQCTIRPVQQGPSGSRQAALRAGQGKCVFGNVAAFRAQETRNARINRSMVIEANMFDRLSRVAKSYANNFISNAEDPEKMLDQTVNEMSEDLIKMRQATAQVMASQKQLETKFKAAQQTADDWYRRAQLALQKGDEELAKEALKRRKSFQENADGLKNQFTAQKAATDGLLSNTRMLEQKIQEAKSKKDTLKARAQSAKTSKQVQEMVGGLSSSNAMAAFERMEEKVLKMEAESDATAYLASGDTLSNEFALLEAGSVDDDLAKMKAALNAPVENKKLPQTKQEGLNEIDSELEELRRKAREL